MCIHIYVYVSVYIFLNIHLYTYLSMCTYIWKCVYTYICHCEENDEISDKHWVCQYIKTRG